MLKGKDRRENEGGKVEMQYVLHFLFFDCEAIGKENIGGEIRKVKDGDRWNL